jgi:hypothetical protein
MSNFCSVSGCNKKSLIRGLCKEHYRKWLVTCSVDGCGNVTVARHLCNKHYRQWLRIWRDRFVDPIRGGGISEA